MTVCPRRRVPTGFTLVVTLSLMILLTVIAVGLLIQQTYQSGRDPSLFRRWLISDPAGGRDLKMVLAKTAADPTVEMVPVVAGASAADRVNVPKLPINQGTAATGAIAWWLADESQKARINLHERQAVDQPQAAQIVASHGGRPGVEKMTAMTGFKTDEKTLDRMVTTGQASLTAKDAGQLVLLRQSWIIATRFEQGLTADTNKYFLCAVPDAVYWNPYNVPMKVASNEILSCATLSLTASIEYKVYKDASDSTPVASGWVSTSRGYVGYGTPPRETGNGDIEFKPGEVRAFSVGDGMELGKGVDDSYGRFFAEPGYQPLMNTAATRGLQEQIAVPAGSTAPTLSLQQVGVVRANDNYYWGNSERAASIGTYQNNGKSGLYDESGSALGGTNADTCVTGGYSIDWLTSSEISGAWVVGNSAATRARWNQTVSYPVPIAIISIMAKSPEQMPFEDNGATYAKDFGNRTWLHTPPTALSCYLMNPSDLTRSDCPYQLHFRPVNGDQEVSRFLQVTGQNAYFGGGYGPATGQTQVVALELPTAPVTNLAGFAGMRVDHARAQKIQTDAIGGPYPMFNLKHLSHIGAAFGPGSGNAYAHPMIAADKVYTRVALGADRGHPHGGFMSTGMNPFDDHWDHLFLANEGLWDSWFCSGLVPEINAGQFNIISFTWLSPISYITVPCTTPHPPTSWSKCRSIC